MRAITRRARSPTNELSMSEEESESWCALYCGGSVQIKRTLKASAHKLRIGWEAELFDW